MRGQPTKGIEYFKRHKATCKVKSKGLKASHERTYMDCDCAIWIQGNVATDTQELVFPRQSTFTADMDEARDYVRRLLHEEGQAAATARAEGPTVAGSIKKFKSALFDRLKGKTVGQYDLVLGKLEQFLAKNGVSLMTEVTLDLLETFQSDGLAGYKTTTKATMMAKVHKFIAEAQRRGWITQPLIDKLILVRAVYEEKVPFTEDEVKLILEGALLLNGGTHGYSKHPKTFRLLLDLMLQTGMRVGDAVMFDPRKAAFHRKLFAYNYIPQKRKKTDDPRPHTVFLKPELKEAIDNCQWLSTTHPFKWGSFKNPSYLSNEVYYRMQTIGERCKVADCRPHRLRDTFAVRLLLAGKSLSDVSRLLGHSSVKVTEKYYATWVRERIDRLEDLLAAS